jgi:hypothetical protein
VEAEWDHCVEGESEASSPWGAASSPGRQAFKKSQNGKGDVKGKKKLRNEERKIEIPSGGRILCWTFLWVVIPR